MELQELRDNHRIVEREKTIIAAIGDIHTRISDKGQWQESFSEVSRRADVSLICGDLTYTGDEEEAEVLVEDLKACSIPVVAVLGNHDFEKGRQKIIRQFLPD